MNVSSPIPTHGDAGLELLWDDGERVFCRELRRDADGNVSSVLIVRAASEHPPAAVLDRLAHEYALRDELDRTWAVRPLDLIRDGGRTLLILEDPGSEPLERQLGTPMTLDRFLRLALAISTTVDQLHRRGLIHKDVKPANLLVTGADEIRITGFGLATRLPRERQQLEPPETIAGTLAYMAPEQTGRMNRSIDSRSDLYAIGVTLYRMLTGALPFTAANPMEWVHSHIARRAIPPAERRSDVPDAVSAIIMKLLAKTTEDRYQTAAGLKSDLAHCLAEWQARGRIDGFTPGEADRPDRLMIPERLYGREHEIEALLASFDRVARSGTPELVLISGYAGIGKSAVVHELHRALVPLGGLFASGKFDQYKRDIPYATLAQAFQNIVRRLLAKDEAELAAWRDTICEALTPNSQLVVDLVPELKLVIGHQPPVPEASPQDARRRFQLVLQRFIGVFARPDRPLVLFLDDLQWLDAATLDLLEELLTRSDLQHVLLIGAYRSNEIDADHPLRRKLAAIHDSGALVRTLSLASLNGADAEHFIVDALRSETARAAPLAQLVHEKTGGNPFFLIQFLHALSEEGLLAFDHEMSQWQWDLERIHAKGYTENVVDLMIRKLSRLPDETRMALQTLACLGSSAEIPTLSLMLGRSEQQVQLDLIDAVRLELVELQGRHCRFVHDRVQEAAYALIPESERPASHLRIGRLLVARTPPEQRETAIFDIVNQLNRGLPLVGSPGDREQIAELNLIAGQRAKASSAYSSALAYLATGSGLLSADCWARRHELAFTLEMNRATCEFLTGEPAVADDRLAALATRAANSLEQAAVACLRMDVYTTLGQSSRAVDVGLGYLRRLGVHWSPNPTEAQARREYDLIWSGIGERSIEDLVKLPLMSDPASLATMDVLTKLLPPALFTDMNLLSLTICRAVNLGLEWGHSDGSCVAYVQLGMVAGLQFGDYKSGFRFGELGYELVEQRGMSRFQAATYLIFGAHVVPWTRHFRAARDLLRRAFESAHRSGDLTYAAYSCSNLNGNLFQAGDPLVEVLSEAETGLAFARKMGFGFIEDIIAAQLGLFRTLRGLTPRFGSFDDEQFDELRIEEHFAANPNLWRAECIYWILKLRARFLAGDRASAVDILSKLQRRRWTPLTPAEAASYHFYAALSLAALPETIAAGHRRIDTIAAHHRQLRTWAENCPDNFEHCAALVGAEIARLEGRDSDAMRLYEHAVRSARTNGLAAEEGLAYELAANFYAARDYDAFANIYRWSARDAYARWGADGKVRQIDDVYPHLAENAPVLTATDTIGAPIGHLDLVAALKVSEAVSGEIVLEKLIDILMRTTIEHAGAERGLLILQRDAELRIRAEASTRGVQINVDLCDRPISQVEIPESLVLYAARTHESAILDDAAESGAFRADRYIQLKSARSILVIPLTKQGSLVALLYLENNLAKAVFTPARVALLKFLASEAATSLDNARLYRELQEREQRYREAQMELAHANRVAVMGQLTASIAHEVNQPNTAIIASAQAALSWLDHRPPALEQARRALTRTIENGIRSSEVIGRIRDLIKKSPPKRDSLAINNVIGHVIELTQAEAARNGVSIQMAFADRLPKVIGDRVELQQVTLNLILNAIEAISGTTEGKRELLIQTARADADSILVSIADSGPGLSAEGHARLFEPFYTTKSGGLGVGLSICHSIIVAHGGRLWAAANEPRGAVFQFTVPIDDDFADG
ncbi:MULTISPECIES: trifunctional serine/threonine-protein kinase/ATP-binding protein/sensor histidine kinase [Bradyrhizobium]|uniref:trifunctional serine/threonine-protein kinase/ATP-binding protein/sensor histidine kinase n=1 Tax=Bradyrhizobium TaxID=374 RepID=UPI0003F4E90E|nr:MULTISPECIES: AAA family ATPase [Bradyrhizobium]UFW51988.1 AAA family ATPase [Bradyrhizobium arachidis]